MIGKIVLITALALSLAEGCEKRSAGTKACDIRVNVHPHYVAPEGGKGRGKIEAAIKAWCDKPPLHHVTIVRLEVQDSDGKTWKQVGREERDTTIPTSAGIVVRASTECVDGIWRVYARAEARGPDPKRPEVNKDFVFEIPAEERMARSIKCPAVKLP